MRIGVAAGAGVRDRQALEVAVAGFPKGRVDADISRAARHHQMSDALRLEHVLKLGMREGPVAGLVDDDVLGMQLDLRHNLESRASPQEHVRSFEPGPSAAP
jgi:hypothetical protein